MTTVGVLSSGVVFEGFKAWVSLVFILILPSTSNSVIQNRTTTCRYVLVL